MEHDLYKILGVDREATPEEIERAYRDRALILHPDHGGDIKQFTAIAHAKKVLTNAEARAKYDETGESVKPSEVEETINDLVANAFAAEPAPREPIRWMMQTVDKARSDAQVKRDRLPVKIAKLQAKLEKFIKANAKTKNEAGREMLEGGFKKHMAALDRELKVAEHHIQVANAVLTVLNDLQYPVEGYESPFSSFYSRQATWGAQS